MIFPAYKSSNGHSVTLYGRLFFQVSSASRKNLDHFVDLERTNYPDGEGRDRFYSSICTCEAWKYGERPCRHIFASFEAIAEWANVEHSIREEWIDRLMFLLNMGRSFTEALESDSLKSLRPLVTQKIAREYTIKIDRQTKRIHEAPATTAKRAQRRLPARVHCHPARSEHKQGA